MPPKKNTEKKGGWVYAKELSPKEKEVQEAGFHWVSISHIKKETPLGRHSHHSRNTHLIIDGRITFFPLDPTATTYSAETESNAPVTEGGRMKPPRPGLGERTSGVMESRSGLFTVMAGETYQAALSKCDLCSFVEGHECLSPTTRDRFIVRKDIKWDAKAKAHAVGEVMDEVFAEGNVTKQVWAGQKARERKAKAMVEKEDDGLIGSMKKL